jgi:hypothetical protein
MRRGEWSNNSITEKAPEEKREAERFKFKASVAETLGQVAAVAHGSVWPMCGSDAKAEDDYRRELKFLTALEEHGGRTRKRKVAVR